MHRIDEQILIAGGILIVAVASAVATRRARQRDDLQRGHLRHARLVGSFIRDLDIPRDAIVMLIVRDGTGIPPRGSMAVAAGDRLYILVRGESRGTMEDAIGRGQGLPAGQRG